MPKHETIVNLNTEKFHVSLVKDGVLRYVEVAATEQDAREILSKHSIPGALGTILRTVTYSEVIHSEIIKQ